MSTFCPPTRYDMQRTADVLAAIDPVAAKALKARYGVKSFRVLPSTLVCDAHDHITRAIDKACRRED